MTIDEENLNKIINKSSETIKYKSTSLKYPMHSCLKKDNEKSQPDSENNIPNVTIENKCFTKKDLEKRASLLIKQNLHMNPLWHKNNLKINNINLPLIKIRDLLYSLRGKKFPDDFIF